MNGLKEYQRQRLELGDMIRRLLARLVEDRFALDARHLAASIPNSAKPGAGSPGSLGNRAGGGARHQLRLTGANGPLRANPCAGTGGNG